jgi:threonine dehydratase
MKKDAIQGYGAEVIFFDRATDDLDEVIKEQVE